MGFLIDECKGYFDGFWDLSPGPFPTRKGEKSSFDGLGCSDGIDRGHKAIKNPSPYPLAKPILVPPFLAGRYKRQEVRPLRHP